MGAASVGAAVVLGLGAPAFADSSSSANNPNQNYYDPSGVGLPSGNGGDNNGLHLGRPAAGTVGKADAKDPKGQLPDETDGNNGYECDGNKGIALTNPAHTGCQPSS
jgi:hypothetical protein